jgi:RNA polymerase primary sigma factor
VNDIGYTENSTSLSSSKDYLYDLYRKDIGESGRLDKQEQIALFRKSQEITPDGMEARLALIRVNQGLVVRWARHYSGLAPYLDLIQGGNLGLIKALEKYNPSKGESFTGYADWWVRKCMSQEVISYERMRIPSRMRVRLTRYRVQIDELAGELTRNPTCDEIYSVLGISPDDLRRLNLLRVISLEDVIDSEKTIANQRVEDTDSPTAYQAKVTKDIRSITENILAHLTPDERRVIEAFFKGTEDLSQIAKEWGFKRATVYAMKDRTLKKMQRLIKAKWPYEQR